MTPDECQRFADTMRESFPDGPTARIWRRFAHDEHLDLDLALVAYRRCRREHAHTRISIAAYFERYTAVRREREHDLRRDDPPKRCELCDDTGWTEGPAIVHNAGTESERSDESSQPCVCSIGRRRRDVHSRILEENGRR